ncbi:MAG: thiolase family protein [Hyphomicrobiales bacterium]|nr:thiolase family protein [Hyphomicrobiales bacterium]
MKAERPVIIAARRTAIGRQGGIHARRKLDVLTAPVIQAVLSDAKLAAGRIDALILGNAAGGGGNPARLIALSAGLPVSMPAQTLDTQCASGLDAIVMAARLIETGAAEIVLAGGAESPSTAPWRVRRPANPYHDIPQFFSQADFAPGPDGETSMIEAAENIARDHNINRDRQDHYALESHQRAVKAMTGGAIDDEITATGNGANENCDEGPRASITSALLARIPPLLGENRTVTAGNSCQINDGACVTLIVSKKIWRGMGTPPGLAFIAAASAGIEPRILGLAAVSAARKLEKQTGFAACDAEAIELNEAFAAQTLATLDLLSVPLERSNIMGGALAFGHPYGASGALLVTRLFTRLTRQEGTIGTTGVALIAGAGGIGTAAQFQRV